MQLKNCNLTSIQERITFIHNMGKTITIKLSQELSEWLAQEAKRAGRPKSQFAREQLEKAKAQTNGISFSRFSGVLEGLPSDLSRRKGFSK